MSAPQPSSGERVPNSTAPTPQNDRYRDTTAEEWDTQDGRCGR